MYGDTLSAPVTSSGSLVAGLWVGLMFFYVFIIFFAIAEMALLYVSYWFLFQKAGRKPWPAVIPILNQLMLLDIAGKPWWWIFMFYIPVANIVFEIMLYIDLARAFGKSGGWAAGLLLLPYVFFPILAFSKNITYLRPVDFPQPWLEI
ncbi:MAG: DUF5684 domain-containing protein [Coriobacteriia bacterium]|nr:DUF5684 domain-containing protein [Coriobacteriia bacterium]